MARRNFGLWALIGVLLTSLYTFRMIFVVFFGEAHKRSNQEARLRHAHSVFRAGFALDRWRIFQSAVWPISRDSRCPGPKGTHAVPISELASEGIAASAFLLGVYLAYIFFLRKRAYADRAGI